MPGVLGERPWWAVCLVWACVVLVELALGWSLALNAVLRFVLGA